MEEPALQHEILVDDSQQQQKASTSTSTSQPLPPPPPKGVKPKITRASRACIVCRKMKMKCYATAEGPCKRCRMDNLECVFEESRRGKHRNGGRKSKHALAVKAQQEEAARNGSSVASTSGTSGSDAVAPRSQAMAPTMSLPQPITDSHSWDPPTRPALAQNGYHSLSYGSTPSLPPSTLLFNDNAAPTTSASSQAPPYTSTKATLPLPLPPGLTQGDAIPPLRRQRLFELLSPEPSNLSPPSGPSPATQLQQQQFLDLFQHDSTQPSHQHHHQSSSDANAGGAAVVSPSVASVHSTTGTTPHEGSDAAGLAPSAIMQSEGLRNRSLHPPSNATLAGSKGQATGEGSGTNAYSEGLGSEGYFDAPLLEDLAARRALISAGFHTPEILDFISPGQVKEYFAFYFAHMHPHFPILSATLHTPEEMAGRSPFLLTVCALASRAISPGAEVTQRIARIVTHLAFAVPARGTKTVEVVQACCLLSVWSVSSSGRPREENTSVLLSLAQSIGQDLALDVMPLPSQDSGEGSQKDYEYYNRCRTWICCFLYDNYLSIQLGLLPMIKDTPITRNPLRFMAGSAEPFDMSRCYETDLLRMLTQSISMLQAIEDASPRNLDHVTLSVHVGNFERQCKAWKERADSYEIVGLAPDAHSLAQDWRNLLYNHSRLVIYSYCLKAVLDSRNHEGVGLFFPHCYTAATAVLACIQNDYAPHGWLRYAPDHVFVIISYAAVALLRFCRPQLAHLHVSQPQVMDIVHSTVDTVEAVAVTSSTVAGQHAALLRQIIHAQEQGLRVVTRVSSPRPMSPVTQSTNASPMPGPASSGFSGSGGSVSDHSILGDTLQPIDFGLASAPSVASNGVFNPIELSDSSDLFGGLTLSLNGLWDGVMGDTTDRWDSGWPFPSTLDAI